METAKSMFADQGYRLLLGPSLCNLIARTLAHGPSSAGTFVPFQSIVSADKPSAPVDSQTFTRQGHPLPR